MKYSTAVLGSIVTILLNVSATLPVVPISETKQASVREALKGIAQRYDCYFTIESGLVKGNLDEGLEKRKIENPPRAKSLNDALRQLAVLVPNFAYRIDSDNPKIVFIYDSRLLARTNYGMDKHVTNFSFEGPPTALISELEAKGVQITAFGAALSTDLLYSNPTIVLRVRNASLPVRELLTKPMPLDARRRILWVARTDLDSNSKTYIRFD